jgi:hypothetical protein
MKTIEPELTILKMGIIIDKCCGAEELIHYRESSNAQTPKNKVVRVRIRTARTPREHGADGHTDP